MNWLTSMREQEYAEARLALASDLGLARPRRSVDHDHCAAIRCECGFKGAAIPMRQHMECPMCRRVVEACCEGVPDYS